MSCGTAGVRRAGGEEAGPISALWLALTEHHARLDPLFTLRAGAAAAARRLIRAQLRAPDVAIFVSGPASDLGGLCIARVDRAPPIHPEVLRAELSDLFVAPAQRRRGIGRALLAAASDWARGQGARRVEVRVLANNVEAQAFWRAAGFSDHMDVLHRPL